MILSKSIKIRTFGNKKLKHYSEKGYDICLEEIEVNIEDLPLAISNTVTVMCDYCGSICARKFVDYNRIISKNKTHKFSCSKKCGVLNTNLSFPNQTEHPLKGKEIDKSKLEIILDKRKKTNLEKWGVEYPLQNNDVLQKFKQTTLDRFGVENFAKSELFKNKQESTCIEKWNVKHHSQLDDIKQKKVKTNLDKWGVECTLNIPKSVASRNNIFTSQEYRTNFQISKHPNYIKYLHDSISLFNCDCSENHQFEIKYDNFRSRLENNIPLYTVCNPISENSSIKEQELYEYITNIYEGNIIQNYRDQFELDIFLPDIKIGFEFNGLWWHSTNYKEKNYHINKSNFFRQKGIRVIHIWESDWIYKQSIIKSQIQNLVGKSRKIGARNCTVEKISDVKITNSFLNNNHIQGFVRSNIKLGLFYNAELVAVMVFDKYEGRKKLRDNEWNISRFCNKIDLSVIGGASKLLKFFIQNYKPQRVISYADRDWSSGNLYYNLGFKLLYETPPDYKYVIDNKLVHKSRFRKSSTGISESKLLIPKVWNCGKMKFELVINS